MGIGGVSITLDPYAQLLLILSTLKVEWQSQNSILIQSVTSKEMVSILSGTGTIPRRSRPLDKLEFSNLGTQNVKTNKMLVRILPGMLTILPANCFPCQ